MSKRTPTLTLIQNQFHGMTVRPPSRGQRRTARMYPGSGTARTLSVHEKNTKDISQAINALTKLQGYAEQRQALIMVKWLLDGNIRVSSDQNIPDQDATVGSCLVCKCADQDDHNRWMHSWHLRFNRATHEIIRSSDVKMETLCKILQTRLDQGWIKDPPGRGYAEALITFYLKPWDCAEWLLE
ncbi:MAG: hypothetical protein ABIH67_00785 [Candidatus Uhrbacteria bacterium]